MQLMKLYCLFFVLGLTSLAHSQPLLVQYSPFRSATVNVTYSDSISELSGQIYIDNHGERVVADYQGIYENKSIDRRIMRRDYFYYIFNHAKKTIVKIPINPAIEKFARKQMVKISDTVFLRYNCDFCRPIDDSLAKTTAIFYNELLLKIKGVGALNYEVTKIEESINGSNVFAIPRDYLIKEMNYNFETQP